MTAEFRSRVSKSFLKKKIEKWHLRRRPKGECWSHPRYRKGRRNWKRWTDFDSFLNKKRFAETRSHWRNPMFPGDWGSAPTSKMSSPAYSRIAHFCKTSWSLPCLLLWSDPCQEQLEWSPNASLRAYEKSLTIECFINCATLDFVSVAPRPLELNYVVKTQGTPVVHKKCTIVKRIAWWLHWDCHWIQWTADRKIKKVLV